MRRLLLAAGCGALIGASATFFVFTLRGAMAGDSALPAPAFAADAPLRLIIPMIGVNAAVQEVGIKNNGTLGVPSNFVDVGWFAQGPAPGQDGTAIIDGHVDNALGLAGVFKRLDELEPGDIIEVRSASSTLTFVVRESTRYPYTDSLEGFRRTGSPQLILITCAGSWLKSARTYDSRLVVVADLQQI